MVARVSWLTSRISLSLFLMNDMQQRFQPDLRLISSSAGGSSTASARAMPSSACWRPRLVDDERPRRQLLQTMMLVGDARQAAANRLTAKHRTAKCTIATLILLCVGIWSCLLWQIQTADHDSVRRFGLIAIACAAVAFLLLMLQLRDERTLMRVHQLELCAAQIRQLRDAFASNRPLPGMTFALGVHEARHAYLEIVRHCPVDHSYADYLKARLSPTSSREARFRAAFHRGLDVYSISIVAWVQVVAVVCLF